MSSVLGRALASDVDASVPAEPPLDTGSPCPPDDPASADLDRAVATSVALEANIDAVAALIGAAVMVGLIRRGQSRSLAMAMAICCFAVRVVSVWLDWNLPVVGR